MGKKILARFLVPAAIIAVIAGIWVIKNAGTGSGNKSSETPVPAAAATAAPDATAAANTSAPTPVSSSALPAALDNPDFDLEVSSIDLDRLKSYKLPIIIDFGADSCIPCREMAPVLKLLNAEMRGRVIVRFADVWKNNRAADGFPIQVIPTQVFFAADGKPYVPSKDIDIQFTMYKAKATGEHVFTVHQGGLTEEQMRAIISDMEVAL